MTKEDKDKLLKSEIKKLKAQLKRRDDKIARLDAKISQLEDEFEKRIMAERVAQARQNVERRLQELSSKRSPSVKRSLSDEKQAEALEIMLEMLKG